MVRYVITSPLSLARLLWWYGEDDLWPRALDLSPPAVAYLAPEFAELRSDPAAVAAVWPSAPDDGYLLLPAIGLLEGAPRPAVRRHRRPDAGMPADLALAEDVRWADPALAEVARLVDEMAGTGGGATGGDRPAPADARPRLHGRWAPRA